mgnify:CR=1 FL=1
MDRAMNPLALLAALHALGPTPLAREEGRLLLPPALPGERLEGLRPFKRALLNALEDEEEVEASKLLSSPYRLAALLAHALGVEAPVVLTIYARGEAEPRRYLAPTGNLTPHLAWASRSLPPPRRLHLAPTTGGWALEVWEGWEVAVEALEDLRSFYRTLTAGGFMTKRLFRPPPGLVTYEAPKLALPKEGASLIREARKRLKEVSREALPEERGLVLSFRENLSRALLERLKLTASLPFIHELLEEGWHVALFLAYRQERLLDFSTPESVTSFLEASRLRGNKGVLAPYVVQALSGLTLAMENPMETLRESFAHLGEELAFYTGAQSQGELRRALEAWDEGKVRLLVLTQAKGGVGLSLHDTRGGRPTAQVVLTLPWTAIDLDQVLGRVVRVGLKSPAKVVLPLAPMAVEAKLGAVIAQRLKVLGYAVRGGELSLPKELLDAFEYGLAHLDPEGMERAVLGEEALV